MKEKDRSPATLNLSYRSVALGSALIAVGSIASLAIVASLENADALASTAMALAIITFVVQLIVYVAQAEQSRQFGENAQSLHGELQSSLADLTARAHGTEKAVETISEKMLNRALQVTGSEKFEALPPEFTRDVAENIAELLVTKEDENEGPDVASEFPRKTWGPEEDERILRQLLSWPSEEDEVEELSAHLKSLTKRDRGILARFAEDELGSRDPNTPLAPGVPKPGAFAANLYEQGLIRGTGQSAYGTDLAVLTDKGRKVARVFTAEGDPPSRIADLVSSVRRNAEEVQDEMEAMTDQEEPE